MPTYTIFHPMLYSTPLLKNIGTVPPKEMSPVQLLRKSSALKFLNAMQYNLKSFYQ